MSAWFAQLRRFRRQFSESGVWTPATLAHFRNYAVALLRAEQSVFVVFGGSAKPLSNTNIVKNTGGTIT